MQIVEALADASVKDAHGAPAYSLEAGHRYVLYDSEVAAGLRSRALRIIGQLTPALPRYLGQPLDRQRLLLPFIGRLGDAVAMTSCIAALRDANPRVRVDVACLPRSQDVLRPFPDTVTAIPYPIRADALERYDYHMSFESIEAVADGVRRSLADLFHGCLHTPKPTAAPRVVVPDDARRHWPIGGSHRPRVAVHVGPAPGLRVYSIRFVDELVAALVGAGMEVWLVSAAANEGVRAGHLVEHVRDLTGQTPSSADLAAVLVGMSAVVTFDSFPMHLAGAIGIPTLGLFTSTDAVLADDYPSVRAVQSGLTCSPCGIADGPCPLGHGVCIAHDDASLSPRRIAERVCDELVRGCNAR